jgi:protein-L-isoaspartate(D-aspartate) O-methyltransferase
MVVMPTAETRDLYAQQIKTTANIRSESLVRALATVPREEFVGAGPWRTLARPAPGQRQATISDVSDSSELYSDVAVYLDQSKTLTNGNPSTLAPWLDALGLAEGKSAFHLGCGTGYYTAVMAEVVGSSGCILAAEIDPALASQARSNLSRYPNVQVVEGDGGDLDIGVRDAILVNAGVTHPAGRWLDSLAIGGTLVLPMTVDFGMPHVGKGLAVRILRREFAYEANFLPVPVMIYSCSSVRDPDIAAAFGKQMMAGGTVNAVRSLRRDTHVQEASCWLHSANFCFSTQAC